MNMRIWVVRSWLFCHPSPSYFDLFCGIQPSTCYSGIHSRVVRACNNLIFLQDALSRLQGVSTSAVKCTLQHASKDSVNNFVGFGVVDVGAEFLQSKCEGFNTFWHDLYGRYIHQKTTVDIIEAIINIPLQESNDLFKMILSLHKWFFEKLTLVTLSDSTVPFWEATAILLWHVATEQLMVQTAWRV